jgi:hypothetical protein
MQVDTQQNAYEVQQAAASAAALREESARLRALVETFRTDPVAQAASGPGSTPKAPRRPTPRRPATLALRQAP